MSATDDKLTLVELKSFAVECDNEADRLNSRDQVQALVDQRARPDES